MVSSDAGGALDDAAPNMNGWKKTQQKKIYITFEKYDILQQFAEVKEASSGYLSSCEGDMQRILRV